MSLSKQFLETVAMEMAAAARMHLMRDGYVAIATLIVKGQNVTPLPFDPPINKPNLSKMLRLLAPFADAIIVIDEVWYRDMPIEQLDACTNPVRNDAARKEGFIVNVESKAGSFHVFHTFERDKASAPCAVTEHSRGSVDSSLLETLFQGFYQ